MKICKFNNVNIHWWGDSLILLRNLAEYYIFTDEEKFLVEHFSATNSVAELIGLIAHELETDLKTVQNFFEIFVENFSEYFYLTSDIAEMSISITGKKSMYYPIELHISLTNMCMQKCIHCYKSAGVYNDYIDFRQLSSFLDCMKGYVPYLSLSGGEPTLHPNFNEIIDRYSKQYSVCVLTSGFHITLDLLNTISKADRGIIVSLYSSNPAIHDKFAGVNGSYIEVMTTIENAIKEDIPVGVTTILSRNNFEDIQRLVDITTKMGVKTVTVGGITSVGRAKENNLESSSAFWHELQEEILKLKEQYSTVEFVENQDLRKSVLPLSPFNCLAGVLTWSINEYGQIQPCGVYSMEELSFGEISQFDYTILYDRRPYIERVHRLPCIKAMIESGAVCPFGR